MRAEHQSKGVTMVELLIGILIMAFIAVVFFSALQSAGREIRFSSENFTSFFLAQKVSQDLSEEIRINPHAFSSLGLENSSPVPAEITHGASIFFTNVVGASQSSGISGQPRGIIDENMNPLYDNVKEFRLAVKAQNQPSFVPVNSKNLFHTEIEWRWNAKTGRGKSYTNGIFFSPLEQRIFDDNMNLNPADVENEFKSFYGVSADTSALQSLSRVHFITLRLLGSSSFASLLDDIQNLGSDYASLSSNDFTGLHETCWNLGNKWYEIAQMTMYAFFVIEKDMKNYAQANTIAHDNPALRRTQRNCVMLFKLFAGALDQSRYYFIRLLDKNIAMQKTGRRRDQVMSRLMDLYRITLILPAYGLGEPDSQTTVDNFKKFLDSLESFSENRNPPLERYCEQERQFLNSPGTLEAKYPQIAFLKHVLHGGLKDFFAITDPSILY